MATLESSSLASEVADAVRDNLQRAAAPLKLPDVTKGIRRPKKVKVTEFREEVRLLLVEDVRLGKVFCYPSGKNGVLRYWSRDEKHLLREKAVELAATPLTLSAL